MTTIPPSAPLRVRLVDESPLVVSGLRSILAEHATLRLVSDDTPPRLVDLTLFDCARADLPPGLGAARFADLVSASPTAVWSWRPPEALGRWAVSHGARGCLAKELPASGMVEALERLAAGEVVHAGEVSATGTVLAGREEDVLHLIADGCSNREIANQLRLSINSVKTYVRSLYRKIGVGSRTQAVLWAQDHAVSARGAMAPTPFSLDDASSEASDGLARWGVSA